MEAWVVVYDLSFCRTIWLLDSFNTQNNGFAYDFSYL